MPASVTASMVVGTIIACYLPKYSDEEVAKLSSVGNSKDLEIKWLVGPYNDPWKIWKGKEM